MPQHQNQAAAVENLQRYLRQLSFHEPTISTPPVDGIFESATDRSLREFQTSRNLPVTGRADRTTWDLLYAAYRASLSDNSPPRAIDVFSRYPARQRIGLGRLGFDVLSIQHMLQELSALYGSFDGVTTSGIYDEMTANAIRRFQSQNRLPVTGEVDLLTWNSLADQYNLIFEQYRDQ